MISPEMGKHAFTISCFVVVVAGAMLPFLQRGTAEFVITVISLVMALLFAVLLWFVIRRFSD